MLKTIASFVVPFVLIAAAAFAAPGDLDPSFGTGGSALYPSDSDAAHAVVLQPDGRLLVGGSDGIDADVLILQNFDLMLLSANGTLDPSFGSGGRTSADFGSGPDFGAALLQQPDGMIVQAGTALISFGFSPLFAAARFDAAGVLDPTFGTNGRALVDFPASMIDQTFAVGRQSDGKLVLAGYTIHGSTSYFALARLATDGTLDATFGAGGLVETLLPGTTVDQATAMIVLPDDRLIVAGSADGKAVLVRFAADGTFDPTFGISGAARTTALAVGFNALARQPDGALVAAGTITDVIGHTFTRYPLVARFDANGAPDVSFGGGGHQDLFFVWATTSSDAIGNAVAVAPDGTILLGGGVVGSTAAKNKFLLARLDATGAVDVSFGQYSGFATGPQGGANALVLQPDSRVVLVGARTAANGISTTVVARYFAGVCGNGALEPGEICEDGNLTSGDGCDANCTPTGCGNAVVTAGEECDDGNTSGGDCCAADCHFEALGSPCPDDGELCSNDTCDGTGLCAHTVAPSPSCAAPIASGKASVQISGDANKGNVSWKWTKGSATLASAFGNPTTTTKYALCIYDHTAGVPQLRLETSVAGGAFCSSGPCWRTTKRGFSYKDRVGVHAGISAMQLIADARPGKSRIAFGAKGFGVPPITLPYAQDPTVTVQLRNSVGGCWGSTHSTAKKNDASKFSAKSD